jgi:hypothetical protein
MYMKKGKKSLPPLIEVLQRLFDKQNRGSSLLSVKLNFDYEVHEEKESEKKKYKTV